MEITIFYMNQGGGGDWGTPDYRDYDVLCLAEWSGGPKIYFKEVYKSNTIPPMSVQEKDGYLRTVEKAEDLDRTFLSTRPIMTFTIAGYNFRVVFFHLKSGNQNTANYELALAYAYINNTYPNVPVLWIGDYNRANSEIIQNGKRIIQGGGQANWYLDRAIITGYWNHYYIETKKVSVSGDNGHIGFSITIS